MKIIKIGVGLLALTILCGCQSTFGPTLGMTETQWLRRTLIADVAYMEGDIKAYRSSGSYYYFVDGVLVKIDEGMIPAQRIQMEIRSDRATSSEAEPTKYDELRKLDQLRKDGIITEEEFQVEKAELLERQNRKSEP